MRLQHLLRRSAVALTVICFCVSSELRAQERAAGVSDSTVANAAGRFGIRLGTVPAETALIRVGAAVLRGVGGLEQVWKGYRLQDKPLILYSTSEPSHALLINYPNAPTDAIALSGPDVPPELRNRSHLLPGGKAELERRGIVSRRSALGFESYLFHFPIAEEDLFQSVDFVFHESFHPFQRQHFKNYMCRVPGVERDVAATPAFREQAEAERVLLRNALREQSAARQRRMVRDYLAARHSRLRDQPGMRAWERHMERQEGTARYVGYRAALLATNQDPERLIGYQVADLEQSLDEMPKGPETHAPMMRWRLYGTGAALGSLLDHLGTEWRARVQEGEYLDELLARAGGFSPPPGEKPTASLACVTFEQMDN